MLQIYTQLIIAPWKLKNRELLITITYPRLGINGLLLNTTAQKNNLK